MRSCCGVGQFGRKIGDLPVLSVSDGAAAAAKAAILPDCIPIQHQARLLSYAGNDSMRHSQLTS